MVYYTLCTGDGQNTLVFIAGILYMKRKGKCKMKMEEDKQTSSKTSPYQRDKRDIYQSTEENTLFQNLNNQSKQLEVPGTLWILN